MESLGQVGLDLVLLEAHLEILLDQGEVLVVRVAHPVDPVDQEDQEEVLVLWEAQEDQEDQVQVLEVAVESEAHQSVLELG
jgi:hypothetical protein